MRPSKAPQDDDRSVCILWDQPICDPDPERVADIANQGKLEARTRANIFFLVTHTAFDAIRGQWLPLHTTKHHSVRARRADPHGVRARTRRSASSHQVPRHEVTVGVPVALCPARVAIDRVFLFSRVEYCDNVLDAADHSTWVRRANTYFGDASGEFNSGVFVMPYLDACENNWFAPLANSNRTRSHQVPLSAFGRFAPRRC